ncbi:transcriptional regulator [Bradyrhizobium sp. KBS0727]|uniref:ATP-binding protein n=1 Tax=unclassified Bradyrhizobium TaxID=2631580 RepID=UPI00110E623F|nr:MULTISPECIES: winged helix-turn-helix domain-containing protein [unclassified Bradyrhizobium]QDW37832.1 transcriptional regulator [Bradyrhizobium sp. KBS0725]QDW44436.1 transcriptional regulator [Bradyrhizobium sp. KBS0727]
MNERVISFGPFSLHAEKRLLLEGDRQVRLGGRAFDILASLVERAGEVVGKEQLIARAWPQTYVEESNLKIQMSALRRALGEGDGGHRYIVTVPGRGYSFVAPVRREEPSRTLLPPTVASMPAHNLPFAATRVIGREESEAAVVSQLSQQRLVTIVGPGGIGKTTVALAVAEQMIGAYEHGVWLVDLAALHDARLVPSTIASVLGLETRTEDPLPGLVAALRDRRMLLLLDTCEHVIGAAADLAVTILSGVAGLTILATSREPLGVSGERVLRLEPLSSPEFSSELTAMEAAAFPAPQLFVERVTAIVQDFVLTDANAPLVVAICRKLDGLPLAIEFAAPRVEVLGLEGLASRLDDGLRLIGGRRRGATPRHQTMQAVVDWSYKLLGESEQGFFRALGIFTGGFTVEAAAAVAMDATGVSAIDRLADLVAKSLVVADISGIEPWFRLLDMTGAYALGKLEEHAEFDSISLRHAEYVTRQLEPQKGPLSALPRADRVTTYSRQLSDVRAALEWSFGSHGSDEVATRLAAASMQVFLELSLLTECRSWAERALDRLGAQDKNSRREMQICVSLSFALMHTAGSNSERVREIFSRALSIAAVQGDLACEVRLLNGLFAYYCSNSDIQSALDAASRSKEVANKTNDPDDVALAEWMLGVANHLVGNHLVALKHLEASLSYMASGSPFRAGQDHGQRCLLLGGMARSLLYRGSLDQSLKCANRAIDEGEKSGHPYTLCRALCVTFSVYLALADFRRSELHLAQLTELCALDSLIDFRPVVTGLRGQWYLRQNNFHEGIPLLRRAFKELQAQRNENQTIDILCDLAEGLAAIGEHEEALELTLNAIEVQQRGGKLVYMPALFRVKGGILASRSEVDHVQAESSLLSAIDWAKRQSATLFELMAATDLAELLLKQDRVSEGYKHLNAAIGRMPEGIVCPALERALQILDRFQSGTAAAG